MVWRHVLAAEPKGWGITKTTPKTIEAPPWWNGYAMTKIPRVEGIDTYRIDRWTRFARGSRNLQGRKGVFLLAWCHRVTTTVGESHPEASYHMLYGLVPKRVFE